jgi:transporter family-2 protein
LGAVYVTSAILLAPRLGFATFQLAVTFGQLMSSMICDAVGFLHLPVTPTTPWRVVCLLLLALGTALSADWTASGSQDDDVDDITTTTTTTTSPWWKLLYAMGATVAGSLFPIQSCVNFEMIHHVGTPYRAVAISFTGGVIAVWLLTGFSYLVSETTRNQGAVFSHAADTPPWMWLGGGVLGATFITSAVIGLPSLGAVAFTGIFISTQLVVATIFDALGAFGFDAVPIFMGGGRRVVGVSCAVIAAAAFQMPPPHSWLESWPWSETEEWEGERKPLVQVIRESAEEKEEEEEEDDVSVTFSSLRGSLRG